MDYVVNNKIFFKNKEEAEEFTKTIGGHIDDYLCDNFLINHYQEYYGEDFIKNKTIVFIRASKYFMKSLEEFGIERKKVNGKLVYEKT
jgi:hypothetical protein